MFDTALVCVEAKIEREEEGRIKVRESESNAHTRTLTHTMGASTHTNTHTYKEGVSSKYKEIERECQRVHRSRRGKEKRSREERHFKSSQVGGNMKMMEWGHAI